MDTEWQHEAVVSFDLGWAEHTRGRTAAAHCFRGEQPHWSDPEGPNVEIKKFLERFRDHRTLVLLDIPIHGTSGLDKQHAWRPIDIALMRLGIPLLPSYKAGGYGASLAESIRAQSSGFTVMESYPYAVLRFLWAARGEPGCLAGPLRAVVDTDTFVGDWPPKYKRARRKAEREVHMATVFSLIREFMPLAGAERLVPNGRMTVKQLALLADVYDALMGLLVGMMVAEGSPWAVLAQAGDEDACLPVLLDAALQKRWADVTAKPLKERRGAAKQIFALEGRNVEVKARIADVAAAHVIAAGLVTRGAPETLLQTDTYFAVADGRLKLREDQHGAELIRYTRPDRTGPTRSDYERLAVDDPVALKGMLAGALGVSIVVSKRRTVYLHHQVRIHIDEVEGLGSFMELEVVIGQDANRAEAESLARSLMARFGVEERDWLAASYSDMLHTPPGRQGGGAV